MPASPKPPASHRMTVPSWWSSPSTSRVKVFIAPNTIVMAAPTSTIAVVSFARRATRTTPSSGSREPRNAAAGRVKTPATPAPKPSTVSTTTPKPAPDDTPSR